MPDIDPRWPRLLAAARAWKATMIPDTSTGLAAQTRALREAVEEFDRCDHPRGKWVTHRDGSVECSACTAILEPSDTTEV